MFEDLSRPPLRESELRSALVDGPLADYSAIDVLPEVGSTNAELLERARAGAGDRSALLAEFQSSGRGRLGRSWTAPAGSQIPLSVLIRPGVVHPDLFGWLPLVTGLAVRDALAEHAGIEARLKWPNDVLVGPAPGGHEAANGAGSRGTTGETDRAARKIAGILVEMIMLPAEGVYSMSLPAIVVGVGLNVSLTTSELPVPTATSVDIERTESGEEQPANRTILAKELLRALSVRHDQWRACERGSSSVISEELYREYQDACATIGEEVRVEFPNGTAVRGVAEKVDRSGELVVRDAETGESVSVAAGDVHHVRPGGAGRSGARENGAGQDGAARER